MKRSVAILFILILINCLPVYGQEMTIHLKNGDSKSFPVEQIKSITFESTNKAIQNIAPLATVEASSVYSSGFEGSKAVDTVKQIHGKGEWSALNELKGAWLFLKWNRRYKISKVVLYDRANETDQIFRCTLTFSDGSSVNAGPLPNDGAPEELKFSPKDVEWMKVEMVDVEGQNAGISEIEVYGR